VEGGGSHRRVEVIDCDAARQHRDVEGEGKIGGAQVAVMVGLDERERKSIEEVKSGEWECIEGRETGAGHIVGAVEQNRHTVAGFAYMT
jgi:hypothetical protein